MLRDSNHPDSAADVLAGRYQLEEPIGRGGMSTVYRGRDRTLGRPVAVKLIRHAPDGDPEELRERFRREAENAARIPPHPNVVQIYDYGTDPERDLDFIVMELLRGRDLKTALRERRFTAAGAVRILLEAARGLAAGHRAGVVHRDVKPANFLLMDEPAGASVKVLDFGIAKAVDCDPEDDLTRTGGVPHTPAYASPEQRAGTGTLSPASDVYQLGLVAYELFTGQRAVNAADRERIARGESLTIPGHGRWAEVSPSLRAVVERALRADPGERYPDASAFAEAVAEAAEDDRTMLAATTPITASAPIPHPNATPRNRGLASIQSRWRALPKQARVVLMAGLALLLLWGVFRGWGGDSVDSEPVLNTRLTAELEEEFAPLYAEAAEWLADAEEALAE